MERDHRLEDDPGPDPVPDRNSNDRAGGVDAADGPERDRHGADPRGTARRAVKGRTAAATRVAAHAGLVTRYRVTTGYLAAAGIALAATWPL